MSAGPLDGTVALVTGASSGIGEATAAALVTAGADVAVVARRRDRLESLAVRLGTGARVLVLETDVTDEAQARAAVERTVDELGRLDTLVNNAGVMLLGPIVGAPIEEWRRMVELNLLGLLYCSHAALPHLLEAAAGEPRGVADLVNVSSVAGRVARLGSGVYNATKFGWSPSRSPFAKRSPVATCVSPSSSRARWPPSWPATTGPRYSRPSGPTSRAWSSWPPTTSPSRSPLS
jgi:NADP-dependent 3-hydroxy acid dehydrogenase YdfG